MTEGSTGDQRPDPAETPEPGGTTSPTDATEPSTGGPATPAPRIPATALADRNALARQKGLPGLVITGGEDPDPAAGRAEERTYLRLLFVMVAIIVLGGFVLGFIGLLVGGQ